MQHAWWVVMAHGHDKQPSDGYLFQVLQSGLLADRLTGCTGCTGWLDRLICEFNAQQLSWHLCAWRPFCVNLL
jgi:hypothetical protein